MSHLQLPGSMSECAACNTNRSQTCVPRTATYSLKMSAWCAMHCTKRAAPGLQAKVKPGVRAASAPAQGYGPRCAAAAGARLLTLIPYT